MTKLLLFASCWLPLGAAGQSPRPTGEPAAQHAAQFRHTVAARALQRQANSQEPATAYLHALQAWYDRGFPPSVQAAAEEFFVAHQALLSQRVLLGPQQNAALTPTHDSSSAHLRKLMTMLKTARGLPEATQVKLFKRLAAREQALWTTAQAQKGK